MRQHRYQSLPSTAGGLITVFNRGAEQMLGYGSDEMIGKQSLAIIHLESEVVAREQE
jgi:PAS domain S-box-containing protein